MIKKRLEALRGFMKEKNIDAYVIPTDDFHQSEYVCDYFKAREFMSGFDGSAGTLVVLLDEAYLWTDGRYFLQAADQLKDTTITLMKSGEKLVPRIKDFLFDKLNENQTLGFFGKTMSSLSGEEFLEALSTKNIKISYEYDLVDLVWNIRPILTFNPITILEEKYSGKSYSDKIALVRNEMEKLNANGFILSSLDDIAWLYNIRGNDILYNPVVLSHSFITKDEAYLFVDDNALSSKAKEYFSKNNITILPYDKIYDFVKDNSANKTILVDKSCINYYLFNSISNDAKIIDKTNPTNNFKAIKNQIEIKNLKKCHLKDGIAVTKFIHWLKTDLKFGIDTEISVATKLEDFRKEQENYIEPSFETISGYAKHGAIIHYEPTEKTNSIIENRSFLLVDSGGQYLDGTTDITRTIAMGELTYEEKFNFTIVLRGMIDLANATFMHGCTGQNLDILARLPFWQNKINYNHGTGHGVGFFLNVHEGPHNINFKIRPNSNPVVIEEGMVVTDEPGVYIADNFGIRTENELVCVKDESNEYGDFLKFEILTLAPIDLEAILPELLNDEEIKFLNQYHKRVYDSLVEFMNEDEAKWLKEVTKPIAR